MAADRIAAACIDLSMAGPVWLFPAVSSTASPFSSVLQKMYFVTTFEWELASNDLTSHP
jgi:hypothetical protein